MTKDSINVSVFTALKVSEKSNVPVLIMSNPGVGKSTTVEMFANIRGYHLEFLNGNSRTESEITGYDVADVAEGSKTTKHLRPSWFTTVLEKEEQNVPTLLFLDEITTANEYVQAALLNLIFNRVCGTEPLPKSCLIVAAGNYAANLSNQMTMLPPLMNRFMIFNIVPEAADLDTFLCRYRGAIATGQPENYMEKLRKQLVELDDQEKEFTAENYNKIGEYFEMAIKRTTESLIKDGKIKLAVTELKNIYTDSFNDDKLCGFVSLRTLNYLRDVSIAAYICFGKAGIISDNFRNMIDGLCGIGISRDSRGEVVSNQIGSDYQKVISLAANDLDKLSNTNIKKYEEFFSKVSKTNLDVATIQAILNKISELKRDKSVSTITKPIAVENITSICNGLASSNKNLIKDKVSSDDSILDSIGEEKLIGYIQIWNLTVDLTEELKSLITDKVRGYEEKSTNDLKSLLSNLKSTGFKLQTFKKFAEDEDAAIAATMPVIKTLVKF